MGNRKEELKLKEFDIITDNIQKYKSDGKHTLLDKEDFSCLKNMIERNRSTFDLSEIMKLSYEKNLGCVIQVQNYVGLIQLKTGRSLQILPKISLCQKEDDTKRVLVDMMAKFKDFPEIKKANVSDQDVLRMNILEFFISMYLLEVRQLLQRGIKSAYVEQKDNLNYFRGKLMVPQHVKRNYFHKERFYMSFEEFSPDMPENRIIKGTLAKLQAVTTYDRNKKEIRQLMASFENVRPSVNYQSDFSKIVINRNTTDYSRLMQWSRIFLFNQSFTGFSGSDTAVSFLFPMEKMYESYVAQYVRKVFVDWEVLIQNETDYFKVKKGTDDKWNQSEKTRKIRPDIVIKKPDESRVVVMDTKWISLDLEKGKDVSIDDLHQMYVYSKMYQSPEVWLLYPLDREKNKQQPIIFTESGSRNEMVTTVNVFFIDVANIEDSIKNLKKLVEPELVEQ